MNRLLNLITCQSPKFFLGSLLVLFTFLCGSKAYANTIVVTSLADPTDPGLTTLRDAVAQSLNNDTIRFDPSLANGQITMNAASGTYAITKNLIITADDLPSPIRINGNRPIGHASIFTVYAGGLTLNNLQLLNAGGNAGDPNNVGGGVNIRSQGLPLTMINCLVDNCHAKRHGGVSAWGNTTLTGCTISNCVSDQDGVGGVDCDSGNINISGCTIIGNIGTEGGLDISDNAAGTVSNTAITYNQPNPMLGGVSGGGFLVKNVNLTFDTCTLDNNQGMGMRVGYISFPGSAHVIFQNCEFEENGTLALNNDYNDIQLVNCQIFHNHSTTAAVNYTNPSTTEVISHGTNIHDNDGLAINITTPVGQQLTLDGSVAPVVLDHNARGGIKNNGANMQLTKVEIKNHQVTIAGLPGGVWSINGNMTVESSYIHDNTTPNGGAGIYHQNTSGYHSLTVHFSTVANNTALGSSNGGGILAVNSGQGGPVTVDNSTISTNSAANGGGMYFNPGNNYTLVNLKASTFAFNSASGTGGGFYKVANPNGQVTPDNVIFADDSDANGAPDFFGDVSSFGFNLVGQVDGSTGWGDSDLTGSSGSPLDPMLDVLNNNGGHAPTHALLAGSPALAAGDSAFSGSESENGVIRQTVDIGAFDSGD